jgi:alanyl-tRNA synthetase
MRLHSAAHVVYYFMQEVFGVGCKPASPGVVNERKDASDYLFEEKLDKEKLSLVEQKANEFISKGFEIRTWNDETDPSTRNWEVHGYPKMHCGGTHPKSLSEIGKIRVERGKKPGAGKERIEITLVE